MRSIWFQTKWPYNRCGSVQQIQSTTDALVHSTNTISTMPETNKYVRFLLIDFSKEFDSVDHLIKINKLKSFTIAHNIIQWLTFF